MAGIWTYLIPIVVLIALCALMLNRPRPVDEHQSQCSRCDTPMLLRLVPLLKSHAFLGEWVCPHCRNRFKSGKGVSGTA